MVETKEPAAAFLEAFAAMPPSQREMYAYLATRARERGDDASSDRSWRASEALRALSRALGGHEEEREAMRAAEAARPKLTARDFERTLTIPYAMTLPTDEQHASDTAMARALGKAIGMLGEEGGSDG